MLRNIILYGFWCDLVAGTEDDQILDAADNLPRPGPVLLTLIAGVKPSATEHLGCLLRAIPIAWEYIRALHDNFVVVSQPHVDSRDRGTYRSEEHTSEL